MFAFFRRLATLLHNMDLRKVKSTMQKIATIVFCSLAALFLPVLSVAKLLTACNLFAEHPVAVNFYRLRVQERAKSKLSLN